MSQQHLTTGSQEPPKEEGKLRLYSMEYCPYAQRARLVLKAKNVPHDIVNINLINKPEWYFKIHPEGKVPAIDTGSEVIVESLDIADWLDEKYPENPLYPQDAEAKQRDKDLIQKIGPLTAVWGRCLVGASQRSAEEWAHEFTPPLNVFEQDLTCRGTPFFAGDKPGMVDYMLWPFAERAGLVALVLKQQIPFEETQFTNLKKWRNLMKADEVCAGMYHGSEKHLKSLQIKLKILPPDYDSL